MRFYSKMSTIIEVENYSPFDLENLEDCKHIIGRIGIDMSLKIAFDEDNFKLYLYILKTYNLVPTTEHLALIFCQYIFRLKSYNKDSSSILDFILDKYPELCTIEIADQVSESKCEQAIQKVQKILPTLVFNGLLMKYFYSKTKDVLDCLIKQGFRPEYHPSGFNVFQPGSFRIENLIIRWSDLSNNHVTVVDVTTQSRAVCRIKDIEIKLIEGDREVFIKLGNYINIPIINVITNLNTQNLKDPIFASLRDVPSLKTIAMNIMGANGVSTKRISSELF